MKEEVDGPKHVHGHYSSAQLSVRTWTDFERLFASHGGVWGGCWCMYFHRTGRWSGYTCEQNRRARHALVREGVTHGTILYCGKDPVGWCQFGPVAELPRVGRKRGYEPTAENPWCITCFFVNPKHRRSGLAKLAIADSVRAMKKRGVKTIEAYPSEGKFTASFMWRGTPHMFEEAGFRKIRQLTSKNSVYSINLS